MNPSRDEYIERFSIESPHVPTFYAWIGKRVIDLMICLPALVLASPVVLIAAVLIRLDSRGRVFFLQERLGRYGATFTAFKLRTMTDRPRSNTSEIMPGHTEVTRIGNWLRRFKIDELPQLWNVVRGDMSLVGPRPALQEQLADYNQDGLHRLLARPGLAGLAQVSGNIYLSWPERWQWDRQYVATLSPRLDLQILFKTVGVVLLGEERFLRRPETLPFARTDPPAEASEPSGLESTSDDSRHAA